MLAPALGTARGEGGGRGAESPRAGVRCHSGLEGEGRGSAECARARPVGASGWERKEAEGARRVHSQRTNGSRVLRYLGSLEIPGCLREAPGRDVGEGGVGEEKTEVGRGQNGREGCRAPPPPGLGASPSARRAAVFSLRASHPPWCLRLRLRDTAMVAGSGFRVQEVARPPRRLPAKWGAPIRSPRGGG